MREGGGVDLLPVEFERGNLGRKVETSVFLLTVRWVYCEGKGMICQVFNLEI